MLLASTKTWEFLTRLLLKQRNNSMCVRMFIRCCHGEEQTLLPNCHPPPPQPPVTWWFFCLPSRTSHDSLSESTGTCHPLGQKDGHVNQAWPIIIHVTLTKTWLAQWKACDPTEPITSFSGIAVWMLFLLHLQSRSFQWPCSLLGEEELTVVGKKEANLRRKLERGQHKRWAERKSASAGSF